MPPIRRARVGVAAVGVAAALALAACGDARPSSSTRDEQVELHVVPLSASIPAVRFPWFTSDGDAILFSGKPTGSARGELLSIREDGSAYRCLSCGVAPEVTDSLLKPLPFPDGRRVLLRVGEQSPVHAAHHAVLECQPSVADCARAELVPIVIPSPGDAVVTQDQREFKVSPDGEHVAFTQLRASVTGNAIFTAIVATLQRAADAYQLRDARVVSTRGELKGFTPDAQAVHVSAYTTTTYEAANPDVLRVDLATGAETRVTTYPDYDEPLELSPDGAWYVVGSGRTSGLFETVARPQRPNFIGRGIEPLAAALFVNERENLLQPWLVRAGSEAQGAVGQQLNAASAAEGYSGRAIANWRPDGTRVVFSEGSSSDPTPSSTGATRIVVAHLVGRSPSAPPARRASPEPVWAPPLAGFVPTDPPSPESRAGRSGGSAAVSERAGAGGKTLLEVTYENFSDDGEWVIDGFERAESSGGLTGQTTYAADLRVGGRHSGFLRAAGALLSASGITGAIDSEVDGRRLHLPRGD